MSKNEKGKRNNMKSIKSKAKTNIYLMQPLDEYPHKKNIHTINATHKKILLIILAIILLILISNVNDKIRKQKEVLNFYLKLNISGVTSLQSSIAIHFLVCNSNLSYKRSYDISSKDLINFPSSSRTSK